MVVFLLIAFLSSSKSFARSRQTKSQKLRQVYRRQYAELNKKFLVRVEELAQFCDRNRLTDDAKSIRQIVEPVNPAVSKLSMLPVHVQKKIPVNLSATQKYWQTKLRTLQTGHARQLYLLSRKSLKVGSPSFAFRLIHEAAHYDPDNKSARRLLGFVRQGDRWTTPFTMHMLKRGYVKHEKYGWLPKSHVARYEKGERYYKRKWMSVAQETELRRDFKNAWRIETDHHVVRTNHSLEQGVKIANALEDYYGFFFQTFAGFFNTPEQLKKLFSGGSTKRGYRKKKYLVYYFRTREEYNRRLVAKMPNIAMSNGLYMTSDRIVYSFHTPDTDNISTFYHESSHQIFYESTAKDRMVATHNHFWVIEGIACYLESFEKKEKLLSVGNPKSLRLIAARHYLLKDKYYIPLQQFAAMGLQAFQADENILKNYAQAAGLSHFFMHYNNGEYRDAFIAHISQLYAPPRRRRRTATVQSMNVLTGVRYQTLDEQYKRYMQKMQISMQKNNR
ncbi:hypothetical protein MNBD_PLANCTO02-2730 [hydrothermal vent metagenome]|uniref:DUF1570 domain-containing protein n=1 Tax=hydrothermal vent metagenome TaxID=652676 RepID=A0A3B1DTS4_9ZZZZ